MTVRTAARQGRAHTLRLALLAGAAVLASGTAALAETADTNVVDEVKVTARYREESVTKVPVAISVVSGDAVAAKNLNNLQDIASTIPTVDFRTGASNKDRTVFIRGVGTITTSPGVEPSVSTVIDGVVLSRPGQTTLDLVELERIEVLRGPQGTLFGKNASAGVINIVSKNPGAEPHAFAEAAWYEGDEYRLKAGVSGPLIDGKLGASLSVLKSGWDGNVKNVTTGDTVNGYDRFGGRAKIVATPNDDLTLSFGLDFSRSDEDPPTGVFASSDRVAYPTNVVTANPLLVAALAASGVTAGANNTKTNADIRSFVNDRNAGASIQADWKLGDFTITSITGRRTWKNHQRQDFDQLAVATASIPTARDDGKVDFSQVSQELRITSPKGGLIDYVAGLYYLKADTDEVYRRDLTRIVSGAAVSDYGIARYGTTSENYALFGEGNINFTPKFRAILGARAIRDKLSYYHDRQATTAVALTGIRPNHTSASSLEKDGWSGRAGLQYDLAETVNVYATYSRGYKGPAYNTYFNMQAIDEISLKPETSDSYEAGIKGTALGGRFVGALAIFKTDYENYQANFTDVTGTPPAIISRLINAGSVSSQGVEGDFTLRPAQGLKLGFSFAYTDATVEHFNCPTGAACPSPRSGRPIPTSSTARA
ncbi:TonB-dependent receptor [Caulobacter hibisci]|uniref:TonB-dependent receptor n=1 Tax=Caulobacter hibisci TaxID=2035993 RepID=UPI0018E2CD46|nr:TonB-dependent receptor [Caulobacter hibisci]